MKVYINAWEYNYGGGFNWFPKRKHAELDFKKEQENCKEFSKDNWKAFFLEYNTSNNEPDEITNEIDLILSELIDKKLYIKTI